MKCAARCSSRSAAFSSAAARVSAGVLAPVLEAVARRRYRRIGLVLGRIGDAPRCGRWFGGDGRNELLQRRAFAEFNSAGIFPFGSVEIARQRDVGMRGFFGAADDVGRTPQQLRHRHRLVGGERDKGRIGAILQQSPHQIGQEIAVAADRRVGAMGDVGAVFAEFCVERLAHAVQPLEFESALRPLPVRGWSRPSAHCGWRTAERSAAAAPAIAARRRRSSDPSSPCG